MVYGCLAVTVLTQVVLQNMGIINREIYAMKCVKFQV